jgi:hypothetical protein
MGWIDRFRNPKVLCGIVLPLLAFLALAPILWNGFTNFDDPSYVTGNRRVLEGLSADGIVWAFGTFHFYNWHPLTWLSHMLDAQVFGLNPAGHHLTSLLLHMANTVLLFWFLGGATGDRWKSACVATLFAVHPLHVESVAWVSGRKDLLCAFFMFLAMLAYRNYVNTRKTVTYVLCVAMYAAGLMSKAMIVTFPVLLLLLDHWPLQRFRKESGTYAGTGQTTPARMTLSLFGEKIPFFMLAFAASVVTYLAQSEGGAVSGGITPLENISKAFWSYAAYILKMLWPAGLSVYYPSSAMPAWKILIALFVILTVSTVAVRASVRLPWLLTGWFWYLVALLPVAGFLRIGQHAMADRYTYIPLIGLFLAAVWGGAELLGRFRIPASVQAGVAVAVFAACSILTFRQAGLWHDSVTLFRHALAVTDNNSVAHKNLGAALAAQGKYGEALRHVTESLRIQPEPKEYVSQAWLFMQFGEYENAAQACRNSLALSPDEEKAHFLLGVSQVQLGDHRTALEEFKALRRLCSPYADRLLEHLQGSGVAAPLT